MGRSHLPLAAADPQLSATPALLETLGLLLKAQDRADKLRRPAWEFAVEIARLHATGLTNTDLRGLILQGLIDHGEETTKAANRGRTFQVVENLSLAPETCVVLTERGIAYARAQVGQGGSPRLEQGRAAIPVWDAVRRELRVGKRVVKLFRQRAACQEAVLSAFQEEGWPPFIDDPLSPQPGQDAKRRLHKTITNLNRGHKVKIIHFKGGGRGERVGWHRVSDRGTSEGRARAERG